MDMERKVENKTNVVFLNEPKLSVHEVDQKFNESRIALIPYIKDFISKHERFKGKEAKVTFAQKGVSSLVSIIETKEQKLVLKIRLRVAPSLGDAEFLKIWEQAGVRVPQVIENGELNGHTYLLMNYVDAPVVKEAYTKGESINRGIYVEMGKILKVMHTPEAEGYGKMVNGKALYTQFNDWLSSNEIQQHVKSVQENKFLGGEHGSLPLALQILAEHVNKEKKSSYCHGDFGTGNIFATNPLTIFDPNPTFNNKYIDLGRSVIKGVANTGRVEAGEQMIEGYFGGENFDRKVLHSSILLNAYMQSTYQHRTKNFDSIKITEEYLIKNKHLLES